MGRMEGYVPRSADYIKAGTAPSHYPTTGKPEVAFVGRSNVGKSTLINRLTGRKGLARASNTPGRTQLIQFFDVADRWVFADLPGYGYAKVPPSIRKAWGPMINTYLEVRDPLRLVVLILDIRREPGSWEHEFLDWLNDHERGVLIVATKMDKVPKHKRKAAVNKLSKALGLSSACVFPFSALSGDGRADLWDALKAATEGMDDG